MLNKLKMASIKIKLLFSFALLLITTMIALIYSVSRITYVDNNYDLLIDGVVTGTVAMSKLEVLITDTSRQILLAYRVEGAADRPEQAREIEKIILNNKAEVLSVIDEYEDALRNDGFLNATQKNARLVETNYLRTTSLQLFDAIETYLFIDSPIRDLENTLTRELGDNILASIESTLKLLEETNEEQTIYIQNSVSSSIKTTIIIFIVIFISTIILVTYIIRSISSSIDKFMKSIRKVIREGDFNVDLRSNNTDEISIMSNLVSDMVDVFKLLLDDINRMAWDFKKG